ncbi:ParB/RepB/Spo0J family partition protein [Streptomyces sp. CA-111067]|uniref:ParB/RepB/Spo0J family partition protein n=1 Tax=Streptomyces sp. CA-111067 TaxID=3240046 RepID=UPI003D95E570
MRTPAGGSPAARSPSAGGSAAGGSAAGGSAAGDESRLPAHEPRVSHRTHLVPIGFLQPADSPRLAGEVEEHARALAESDAVLPPIVVHRATMRVVDGMHRLRAATLRGDRHIRIRLVEGSADDAFVLAVKLNAEHGMPLSRRDRTAAAQRIIESHPHWSDRRIASVTGLSPGRVGALRGRAGAAPAQLPARTGRDGRVRPVNGAAGRIAASRVIAESPGASLREIAGRAGVALATACDVRNRMRLGQDPVPPGLRAAAAGSPPATDAPEPDNEPEPPAAPPPAGLIPEGVLARMRRDPSLRMSQSGRALLHLLASHLLTDDQLHDLLAGVPAHRAADAAQAARLCAERWLRFATAVEVRAPEGDADPEAEKEPLPEPGPRPWPGPGPWPRPGYPPPRSGHP